MRTSSGSGRCTICSELDAMLRVKLPPVGLLLAHRGCHPSAGSRLLRRGIADAICSYWLEPPLTQIGPRQLYQFAMHHRLALPKADLRNCNITAARDGRQDQRSDIERSGLEHSLVWLCVDEADPWPGWLTVGSRDFDREVLALAGSSLSAAAYRVHRPYRCRDTSCLPPWMLWAVSGRGLNQSKR